VDGTAASSIVPGDTTGGPTAPSTLRRSPAQLDLELRPVVVDLELHFELDLVGDAHAVAHRSLRELELVVAREVVGQGPQPLGGSLAREALAPLDLDEVHARTIRAA